MRGSSSIWYRIRVNLRHVPEDQRPTQQTPDPDDDPTRAWREKPKLPISPNKKLNLEIIKSNSSDTRTRLDVQEVASGTRRRRISTQFMEHPIATRVRHLRGNSKVGRSSRRPFIPAPERSPSTPALAQPPTAHTYNPAALYPPAIVETAPYAETYPPAYAHTRPPPPAPAAPPPTTDPSPPTTGSAHPASVRSPQPQPTPPTDAPSTHPPGTAPETPPAPSASAS